MKIGKTERKRLENHTRYLFIHRQKDRREKERWPKEKDIKSDIAITKCA